MTGDAIIALRYPVTPDWRDELGNYRKNCGWDWWIYQIYSSLMLLLLFSVFGAAAGMLAIAVFGVAGSAEFLLIVLGVACGWIGFGVACRRFKRRSGLAEKDIYRSGSEVVYEFGPDDFRMITCTQDWRTNWSIVHDLSKTDKALILRTPFTAFLVPLEAFSVSPEQIKEHLNAWRLAKRADL